MPWTPPLARRNLAHGNSFRHSEIVVESSESSLFLKRKLLLALSQSFFVAEPVERGVEQIPVQLGGSVFVGIREGGIYWEPWQCRDATQFAQGSSPGRCKSRGGNRRERVGRTASRDQFCVQQPKPLAAFFGVVFLDYALETPFVVEVLEKLIEETRVTCMMASAPSLVGAFGEVPGQGTIR